LWVTCFGFTHLPLNAGPETHPKPHSLPSERPAPAKRKKHAHKNSLPPATAPDLADGQAQPTADPLQKVNRGTFAFNDVLYRYLLRPIGKATSFLLTKPGLQCLENVLENVESPVRIVGCLFQGKFKRAGQETGKLLVNSTAGVGGLFKVSEHITGLRDIPKEDFGQALASWGVPTGPYIVVPVVGPSNVREIVGLAVDVAANPATWLGDKTVRLMTRGIKTGIENPFRMDLYEAVTSASVDPYVAAREGYLSRRKYDAMR
jgi:phospholipid-binding lipoprotein MlaA